MPSIPNALSQIRRGHTDMVVLALLSRQPLHVYGLYRALQDTGFPEFRLKRATLYPLLARFQRTRWVAGRWEETSQHRRQHVYALTVKGRATLKERWIQWKRLARTIEALYTYVPRPPSRGRRLEHKEIAQSPPPAKGRRPLPESKTRTIVKGLLRHHVSQRIFSR